MESMVTSGSVTPIQAAEGAVRRYCGWHIAPVVTETLVLDGTGTRSLLLPTMRIRSIDSLVIGAERIDVSRVHYSRTAGVVQIEGHLWTRGLGNVEISLTHGYEQAPDEVRAIIDAVAKRVKQYAGAVMSQRAGTQAVNYAVVGGAGRGVPLTPDEKEALAAYRLEWGL